MNITETRINSNANWRQDTGKTASQVASEMNAARVVLQPNSYNNLLDLQTKFSVAQIAGITYAMQLAIVALSASADVADKVQAVALQQMLDVLKLNKGVDFGTTDTQARLGEMTAIIGADNVAALQSLGIAQTYDEVTESDVTAAWDWIAGYYSRQNIIAEATLLLGQMSNEIDSAANFASKKTELQAYLAGV